jgi:aryl-alcohol dehydrogenase-like predicted oxidoreductase
MRYNKMGDSDLLVSEVCLGTMTWGKQNSEVEAMRQLDMAFDKYGVNFVDTAEGYPIPLQPETAGDTDRMIGKWMANRSLKKEVVIKRKLELKK